MDDNNLVAVNASEGILPSESLPTYVARHWEFQLQSHEVEDVTYYSIRDWIEGLTGSRRASHAWENYRDKYKEDAPLAKGMPYVLSNGRTIQMDFTSDEGLYKLTIHLKITRNRPALKAIKDYLAKAGVFVDDARRDPERASEQLAISRRNQALRAGKSEEWIGTREQGVITRKQFTSAIHRLVEDKKRFGIIIGGITNTLYKEVFDSDVKGLRQRLGISTKENPRDHFSRIALAYTTIAEESVRIYLGSYQDYDVVPVPIIYDVVATISSGIGVQVNTIANALQIDALTGRRTSEKQLTQGEFHQLLDKAATSKPQESG